MATQQLKNQVSSLIDQVIQRAKVQLRAEGNKKISELKQKIPTPQELMEKLKSEINSDTCSEKGQEKFMSIYNNINDKLTTLENTVNTAIETLENIENEIKPIINNEGPVGVINSFLDILKTLITPLNVALMALPLAYAANSGPTGSGAAQAQISKQEDQAKGKVKEIMGLVAALPIMIMFYINEAKKLTKPINTVLGTLKFIQSEIIKLKMFLASLLTDFQGQCDALANLQNPQTPSGPIPEPVGPTPLEDYLNLLQTQYNDVYQQLIASGNEKAIERILHINENLENDYYLGHRNINL